MHDAVMVREVVDLLLTERSGTYVDLNLGGGGHAEALCEAAGDGEYRYVGLDLDPDALERAGERLARFGPRVEIVQANHRDVARILTEKGISRVNGMLLDLGMSSWQLDAPERGFSFDRPGPLDMRYGGSGPTAAEILGSSSERALAAAFRDLGELRGAEKLARVIVERRRERPLVTTRDLTALVDEVLRPHFRERAKLFAQVFQALRMLVNGELDALDEALSAADDFVAPGGVLCVIAFESLTDRVSKRHFHPVDVPKDVFGHPLEAPRWERLTKGALRPSERETAANPRARSARLRAGRRLGGSP
jgi:16S rRNA (cytosine1402-N4)-methyltransferase